MIDHQDFYILGIPIDTELGNVSFLRIKDYPDYILDLQVMSMSKLEIIHKYQNTNKNGQLDNMISVMRQMSLYQISVELPELRQAYYNVFLKVFGDEKPIGRIGEDNFEYYRKLIMNMNCMKEEVVNPNPEIQRAIERSKRVKSQEHGKLTFSDICSSIVAYSSIGYKDLIDLTIYQLYMTFHRIGQFKNYDTSTLFATVSGDVNIDNWSKHIDLHEEEKHFISEDQFKKGTGSMFDK